MPVSTFLGLETTLRGILAQQLALDVTGHNISNANTVGYSRQAAVMAPTEAYTVPGVTRPPQAGQLGTGVNVQSYQRMRDEFLDIQYRAQSMRQGSAEAAQDGLRQIEVAVNEPSDTGLNSLLQSYWASWHDVSNAPENLATRQALAQNASSLANGFQSLATQLQTVQSQVGQNVTDTISQVNAIGSQITQLTAAITARRGHRRQAERPARPARRADRPALEARQCHGDRRRARHGRHHDRRGDPRLRRHAAGRDRRVRHDDAHLGQADGLIGLRDTTIPGYQASLDSIASTLITQTNTAHAAGFDLAGNAGGAFFNGTDAATISVNPALLLTPALIAASANGQPGNAGNALTMADMQQAAQAGLGGATDQHGLLAARHAARVGRPPDAHPRRPTTRPSSRSSLDDKRQSVSGVSLDEEMSNLVKFQRGYQASSRALPRWTR